MKRIVVATLTIWTLGCASAHAECAFVRFRFLFGSDAATSMQVGSGQPCHIGVRAGARSVFESVRVSSQASNGTVSPSGQSGVVYRSKPGFRGADSFAFTVTGRGPSSSGPATIRVSVTVQ
jgi:hypothetical protein